MSSEIVDEVIEGRSKSALGAGDFGRGLSFTGS